MTPSAALELPAPLAAPSARCGLRSAVLAWFARHGRELEFRAKGPPDPWGVLVSEVMAQQTQIGRVAERWPGFMAEFPTPAAMAAASVADVLLAWRGLGYNRRAVGLHRAAVAITAAGGQLPRGIAELEALPGVGPYTARAVAAIAHGSPVAAVDVNVRRVVGRIVAGDPAALSPAQVQAAADALVDPLQPGAWTHALMDLGAGVCRPSRPACPTCPAQPWCAAAATEIWARAEGPVRPARSAEQRRTESPRRPATPFPRTSRWLRGRIVDRLRDAPDGAGVELAGPLGSHSPEAVAAALAALARDGIVELDAAGRARLAGRAAS